MDEEQDLKKYEIVHKEGSILRTILIFYVCAFNLVIIMWCFSKVSTVSGIISLILSLAVFVALLIWIHKADSKAKAIRILTIDERGINYTPLTGAKHFFNWDDIIFTDTRNDIHSGLALIIEAKNPCGGKDRKAYINVPLANEESLQTALYNFQSNHRKKQQEMQSDRGTVLSSD